MTTAVCAVCGSNDRVEDGECAACGPAVTELAERGHSVTSARGILRDRINAAVTPWNNEPAMPAPTHISGLVVVAAVKIPTRGSGELAHQWYVVCEDRTGGYTVWHAGWNRSAYVTTHGDYDLPYEEAVRVMLKRAGIHVSLME